MDIVFTALSIFQTFEHSLRLNEKSAFGYEDQNDKYLQEKYIVKKINTQLKL